MRAVAGGCAFLCVALLSGCSQLPGKPAPGPEVPRPDSVLSAHVLYAQNCAGCHGVNGYDGAATPLASPLYQAWIDDATLRQWTAGGEPGSMMPAFSKHTGGDLTDEQIDALLKGMRADWNHGSDLAGIALPPYQQTGAASAAQGQQVYAGYCARCHGPAGGKVGFAGSVLTPSFLALMTPQTLRTAVVVGRPDLGMPDWRSEIPGKPLSNQNINDVVAFLLAQRPGQPAPVPQTESGPGSGNTTGGGAR